MFVYLTRRAEADFDEILNYVAARNLVAALKLGEEIREAFKTLAMSSGEPQQAPVRAYSVKSYVVYYKCLADKIEVLRILHGSRDHGPLLDDS